MATAFTIDRDTGIVRLGDRVSLEAWQDRSVIEPLVSGRVFRALDLGNGYEWLSLDDLTFGGQPATLALGFRNGRLEQVSWGVELPDRTFQDDGWPTRESMDAETAFVRATLARDMDLTPGPTSWGEIWSDFDAKGVQASNGLCYRPI